MNEISDLANKRWAFLIVSIGLWLAVTIRWVDEFIDQSHHLTIPLSIMLVTFVILFILEFVIAKENSVRTHFYLIFQTCLVFIAMMFHYQMDFFAILFIPLSGQATFSLPRRSARLWVGVLIILTFIGETIQFGWPDSLSFSFLYIAGIVFVAIFSENTMHAEKDRERSQSLLAELRFAHQQLQELTGQAQELAVAQERNRLARDLHDSVAQTLYGLTLRSEAALRKLHQGDSASVAEYLEEFQESTQQSLKETRLLIFELRPDILKNEGLSSAIISRLQFVEIRSGLEVTMDIDEVKEIPHKIEIALYRIAQEALNNVIKHAQANKVQVILKRGKKHLQMTIQDDGIGLEKSSTSHMDGIGFQSMQERSSEINAKLEIDSSAEQGTRVFIEVEL